MKKGTLALFLTAFLAVATACGNGSASTGGSTAGSSESSGSAPAGSAAAEAPEAFTMLVWSPSEDQTETGGNWLQKMCEQFNAEHPEWDITFEYGICAEGDAKGLVTQDPEAAADVYMFANDNLTGLVASNAIARLGGDTEEYIRNTNSPAMVDSVSLDGAVYGVPFTTNTWFLYYNTSTFTEEEASSFDTMLEKAKISFPLNNSWYIASFYVANGCTLFGNANDESLGIDFSGDKAVAVTEYLVDLVAHPNFVNDKDGSGMAGLRDGSVHTLYSGSWDYAAVKEILGDNFGAKSLPTVNIGGSEKQLMGFAGSKALGVNPNAENMAAAVALAKYLGGPEAQKEHYLARNTVPCNLDLLQEEDIRGDLLVRAQNDTFDSTSIIQPFVPAMNDYWSPAENFGNALLNKEVTKANAAEMTEQLNTTLNSSGIE
ncbi:MAG: extracellular solute-binding protein [Clostridium sp.]|jgi:arabinogalactan oligomer/maltooligosaccharide transport system substrate-binding protein|nr:extracellular solute-binding protein [Clostridium sp.]